MPELIIQLCMQKCTTRKRTEFQPGGKALGTGIGGREGSADPYQAPRSPRWVIACDRRWAAFCQLVRTASKEPNGSAASIRATILACSTTEVSISARSTV